MSWLGIGAQRSGTTWFTELLTAHPDMSLGRSGSKELHILDRAIDPMADDGLCDRAAIVRAYEIEFAGVETCAGEFTPAYLRCLWTAELAAELLNPVVVIAVLRDPIDRFTSAVAFNERLRVSSRRHRRTPGFLAQRVSDAQWAGCYGPQLKAWSDAMGSDRMVVIQYEQLVVDPNSAAHRIWDRLGLAPVSLPDHKVKRRAPVPASMPPAWSTRLAGVYGPDLAYLQTWGIDTALWTSLQSARNQSRE